MQASRCTPAEPLSDLIEWACQTGEQLQRDIVDLMCSCLTLAPLTPRRLMKLTFDTVQQSAEAFGLVMPGRDIRLSWQEFRNKLQAFNAFTHADLVLNLPAGTHYPLTALVARAEALEPYLAVWTIEGLGYYYAETFWEQKQVPRNLLTDEQLSALPSKYLIPLHTGMGLSFADRLLGTVSPQSHVSEIRTMLRQFSTLCQANAREGYTGAMLEALGLVACNLYPGMIPVVDQQLSAIDPDVLGYFWHGVGRGTYFLPLNSLTNASLAWGAVEMLQREAPHALSQLNALAGLAWAVTLVNIRQPEIIELLLHYHSDQFSTHGAFSNGVLSSIMIWCDAAPDDPHLRALCQHQPDPSDPHLVKLWSSQVQGPCQDALRQYYSVLKEQHGLGEVFRYQSLPELVKRLKAGTPVVNCGSHEPELSYEGG